MHSDQPNTTEAQLRGGSSSSDELGPAQVSSLPGLWRERWSDRKLVLLSAAATTPGMVVAGRVGEDWLRRPELRSQVWPDDLIRVA